MAIIFIPDKVLAKKAEKLVEYNNYLFIDGTAEGGDSKLEKFTHVTKMDIFDPPQKALKDKSIVDGSDLKAKKVMMKHIKDKDFKKALRAVGIALCEDLSLNIFIALRPKVYKKYAKFYVKQFKKFYNTDEIFVYVYNDAVKNKKILKKGIKKKTASIIKKTAKNKKSSKNNKKGDKISWF